MRSCRVIGGFQFSGGYCRKKCSKLQIASSPEKIATVENYVIFLARANFIFAGNLPSVNQRSKGRIVMGGHLHTRRLCAKLTQWNILNRKEKATPPLNRSRKTSRISITTGSICAEMATIFQPPPTSGGIQSSPGSFFEIVATNWIANGRYLEPVVSSRHP